ncbi:hypothetical protein [Kribbella sp. CA-293567]|uniref:hypothetical protein n=1 Tax=Kribbella sp. CA-293567 TaxID=3002436 RepID=UPI0022DE319C|nr:hypothetical protein [Kribbella sp. CA-293567]WBQ03412.1 hypothetical protein OX958_25985 [Kribbella sp. CA-293567]
MSILYLIRSSSSRYFTVPAFLAGLVQLQGNRLWVGEWNMGQQTAVNYALVAVIGVAAGSVLDARTARATVPDLTMSSRRLPPQLPQVVASAFWGYVVLVLLVLVTLGTNTAASSWRTPNFAILLAGAAWITLHSAIGWLLGWYLVFPIAVPMALFLGWMVSAIPAGTPDAAFNLLTGIDDGGFPAGLEPRTAVILTQCLILLALAILVSVPTIWRQLTPRAKGAFLAVPVAALLVAAVSVSVTGPQRRVELVAAKGPMVCADTPVPSCSFPDHDRRRNTAAQLVARMWAPLAAAGRPLPEGIIEDRLERPANWIPVNLWASDPVAAAGELARETTTWHLCGPGNPGQRVLGSGANQRIAWLLSQLDDATAPQRRDSIASILKLPSDQQVVWWYQRPPDISCV